MKRFLLILSLFIFVTSQVKAATSDASDSADIDPEMIKENIKKRIEQVVKNQTESEQQKVAFLGTLSTVTTNSFSIETISGSVKQASTSAYTTFVDINNKSREIKIEDVSLGDYIAALGYLDEDTNVLDARRILVMRTAPTTPSKKSFFGTITKIDLKKSTVSIKNPKSEQEKTFTFTSKTNFETQSDTSRKTAITAKDLATDSSVIITYTPKASGEGEIISTLLTKAH